METCEGKERAVIYVKHGDYQEKIISKNPPIEVEKKPGGWIMHYTYYDPTNGCETSQRQEPLEGKASDSWTSDFLMPNTSCTQAGNWNVRRNGGIIQVSSPIDKPSFEYKPNCTLTIKDKKGLLFKKEFEGECPQVSVGCDDDCPPQHMRCRTTAYPGYRCVPCSQLRR
jgi:hypothetical protein